MATTSRYLPASPDQIAAEHPHKTKRRHPWLLAIGLLLLAMVALVVVAAVVSPQPVSCTPPQCQVPPPKQAPLPSQHTFTSRAFGFSLSYDDDPSSSNDRSVEWQYTLKSSGQPLDYAFRGERANGRSAATLVENLKDSKFPDASLVYSIPEAEIGYRPGFGNVYDLTVTPPGGESFHGRLVIEAAVRHGVAVELISVGPYVHSTPSDGQPNPAETPAVDFFDPTLNSVTWQGDRPL